MATFGALINKDEETLIVFHSEWMNENVNGNLKMFRDLESETLKVNCIDVDKNQELSDALRIKILPTVLLYKKGQMMKRENGITTVEQLTNFLNK